MLNFRTMLPRLWAGNATPPIAARVLVVPVLALASLPYRAAVGVRNLLYDRGLLPETKLPCPVISIGNLTVGGTGKTPLTIMVAKLLREKGYRPAVLSRGYGGAGEPLCVVSDGSRILATTAVAGDEPLVIAQALSDVPVVTGADRTKTGAYAVRKLAADILILDDAFQHRRLFRDLDIVLLRRERPFGNGRLLPRGPLREPRSALQRADILVLTGGNGRTDAAPGEACLPPVPQFRGFYRAAALKHGQENLPGSPPTLTGKKLCAFAGIANPASFRETLTALGGEIVAFHVFPDHHLFTAADIAEIGRACRAAGADMIVTTEKDGVRLADHSAFLGEIFLLGVEMEILPSREQFAALILDAIAPSGKKPPSG